eukprot:IDg1400t1
MSFDTCSAKSPWGEASEECRKINGLTSNLAEFFRWERHPEDLDYDLFPYTLHLEITARADYVKEILQRSRRYGTYEITGDLGFGDAAAHGFSVGFYRTRREAEYSAHLRALVSSHPRFSNPISAEPHLLCLGSRFQKNFRLLSHGRIGRLNKHDVHATSNSARRFNSWRGTRALVITTIPRRTC